MKNFTINLSTTRHRAEVVPITSGTGVVKGHVTLLAWSSVKLRPTHNGTTLFKYQRGFGADGKVYETKSHGNGWRLVPAE
jgi:hypothetical protein